MGGVTKWKPQKCPPFWLVAWGFFLFLSKHSLLPNEVSLISISATRDDVWMTTILKRNAARKFLVEWRRVYVKFLLLNTRTQEQKQQQQSNFYSVHSWTSRNLAALETGKENQTFGWGIWKTLKPSEQLCEPYKTYNGFTGLILAAVRSTLVKAWQKSRDKRRSN